MSAGAVGRSLWWADIVYLEKKKKKNKRGRKFQRIKLVIF